MWNTKRPLKEGLFISEVAVPAAVLAGSQAPPSQSSRQIRREAVPMRPGQLGQRRVLVTVTRVASQPGRCLVALLVQRLCIQSEALRSPGQRRPAQSRRPVTERGRPGAQINGEAQLSSVGETESAQTRAIYPGERKLSGDRLPMLVHVGRN